jgi:dTDP-4-dehydrorhamnose reductase
VRVIIIGAGGLLGTAFRVAAQERPEITELLLPSRSELDITEELAVERYLSVNRPDMVVNAVALLPADLCESHPQAAYAIHALGARWVARACTRIGALAVYISSDFVFDGAAAEPYSPEAATRPMLTYGITKQAGEAETRIGSPRHHVLRTAGLFGPAPGSTRARPCFVHRILEQAEAGRPLSVVDSVVMSPTYTVDLARMAFTLAAEDAPAGTYHAVNSGAASWYEVAVAAVERAGYPVPVTRQSAQTHVETPRPSHTPLAGYLPGGAADHQRPWQEALQEYVDRFHSGHRGPSAPADLTAARS